MSVVDRVDELLGAYCCGGYSNGLVGEANARYVGDLFPDLVTQGHLYRIGWSAWLKGGVTEESEGLSDLLDILLTAEDYPLLGEEYYSQLLSDAEDEWVKYFAGEHGLDADKVWDAITESGEYFDPEGDGVWYSGDEDALKNRVEELSQTYDAHYYSGQFHEPRACKYCADAGWHVESKED
jgi:hypothetical protein